MRQERTVQASLFDLFADHEIGRELKAMSQWLDEHRELLGLAAEDLRRHGVNSLLTKSRWADSVFARSGGGNQRWRWGGRKLFRTS